MKVFILYHPNSEHGSQVESYIKEAERVTGHEIETMSVDTKEGAAKAELYGVVSYPAVVAVRENGEMLQVWQDEMLPTISEVSAYLTAS